MAIWQTGSQLWQILLNNTVLSASGLPYSKLNNVMSKIIASCSAEDAKMIFESLLTQEVGIITLKLTIGYQRPPGLISFTIY